MWLGWSGPRPPQTQRIDPFDNAYKVFSSSTETLSRLTSPTLRSVVVRTHYVQVRVIRRFADLTDAELHFGLPKPTTPDPRLLRRIRCRVSLLFRARRYLFLMNLTTM